MQKRLFAEFRRSPIQSASAIVAVFAVAIGFYGWILAPFWDGYVKSAFFSGSAEASPSIVAPAAMGKLEATDAIDALMRQSKVLQTEGKFAEADPLHVEALHLAEAAFGAHSLQTAELLQTHGSLRSQMLEFDDAILKIRTARGMIEEKLGADSVDYANTTSNLAGVLRRDGQLDRAKSELENALAIFRSAGGTGTRQYAIALENYGSLQVELGDIGAAAATLTEAAQLVKDLMGDSSPQYANTIGALSRALVGLGRSDEAAPYALKAAEIIRASFPSTHPDVAMANQWVDAIPAPILAAAQTKESPGF